MSNVNQYTLFNSAPVRAIDSSTNASPIVVTDVSHGLVTGDRVSIFGHEVNTAANGIWTVTRVNANTFSLDDSTGNGVGINTGCWAKIANAGVYTGDAETVAIAFDTANSGAFTFKAVASDQDTPPDWAAAQSASNQYDFVDIIDIEDGASIDGDTGVVVAGTDDHRRFEINTNGARWMWMLPTAGTAGDATIKFTLFNHN